jgi:hypothetical protein
MMGTGRFLCNKAINIRLIVHLFGSFIEYLKMLGTTNTKFKKVTCKSAFRQNYLKYFAHSSTFRWWVLSRGDTRGDAWWRKLELLTQIAQ